MTKYIDLKGGIGNQLFQYFAGQFIAQRSKDEVVYVLPDDRIHRVHKESSILDLDLPTCVPISYVQANSKFPIKERTIDWTIRKSDVARKILNQSTATYTSGTVGYDANLTNHLSSQHFKGYFQTFRYLNELQLQGDFMISPKSPSLLFQHYLTEIQWTNPNVIHVRGGDYKSLSNSVGLLGVQYYKEAITHATADKPTAPIWVFSDDLLFARRMLEQLNLEVDRIVLPNSGLTAAETLILISKCKSKVIANSTFSWWAAYLGTQTELVVAPNPWNRTSKVTNDLIPSNWKTVDPAWKI